MKISWARCILFTLFVALWISTCSSLKGVDVENPIVNFTPSFLVQPSGESKDTLSCDRIKISGKSRRKLDSYANAYRVTLVPSVVIPETLHSKIQICFHKNASLGSCQCENDNWRSVQNGLWYSVMSPYEDKFLDVRFTGKVLGSVTVTLEEDFQQWRVVCLAVGFVLQLLAPIVSSWVPFYYSSSMAIGIFLVVIILLFQGMKLLPTGRKNFLYLSIYTSVFGAGSYLLHQFSIMINSILLNFGFSEEMHNPVSLLVGLLIGLAGAALGLWLVRKFVISDDGSVDDGVAQFVKWAMRLVGFTCVFQSTLDTSLALTAQGICLMICLASTRFKWKNLDQRNQWLNMSSGGKAKKGKKMSRIEIIPENAEYEDMEDQLRSIGDETPSDDTGEQEENSTRQEKDSTRKRKRSNKSVIPDASSKEQSKEQSEQTEATVNPYAKKERKKRSESWKYLVQYTENGEKWARCTICQLPIKRDKTCSTTQLNRHVNKCKLAHGLTKQTQLQFKKDGNTSEEDKAGKKKEIGESSDVTSADNEFNQNSSEVPQGLNDYESFIRASGAIQEPLKSELDDYLGEKIVFSGSKNFDVLSWWKANSAKYPVLSHMARDILSIPMSTVASESTFSAGSRVIEPHRSCLKPETVEMLLCGADWARELYGLKRTMQGNQDMLEDIEIDLSI